MLVNIMGRSPWWLSDKMEDIPVIWKHIRVSVNDFAHGHLYCFVGKGLNS